MKALVGAFNQEKALVGAFSVIVQPIVEPMEHYTALAPDDGEPLLLVRELDQDLLAEAAHDGLVDGPGEVGGGQEEDAALPLRLQPVQLHQQLRLAPPAGLVLSSAPSLTNF